MHLACAEPYVFQPLPEQQLSERLTAVDVHQRYSKFIWNSILRLGVRTPHVDDVYQEVFLVIHRRIASFSGNSALTTWLFEVCFRVVAGYRRRAHFRREHLVADMASVSAVAPLTCSPEREFEKREAAARVKGILSELKLEHRVVFALFELDGLSCSEISEQVGPSQRTKKISGAILPIRFH